MGMPQLHPRQQRLEPAKGDSEMEEGYPVTTCEIEMAGMTDRGLVKPSNEDSFVVSQNFPLPNRYLAVAGVFDGVGGQAHGDRASSAAAKYLSQLVGEPSWLSVSPAAPEVQLEELMQQLHKRVKLEGLRDPALRGMATTATVALLVKALPATLWIGHVGDSLAFLLRGGRLQKLIREDSLVYDMVRRGLVAPQDAARHPRRHVITQALGSYRRLNPHVASHAAEAGDCLMLCTDGLTNTVSEEAIQSILESESPAIACQQLIAAANRAGGIDNITVVVMKFIHQPSDYNVTQ